MKIFTNTLNKKRFSLIILTIFMITASFASGIENNIEDTDNESINFINPAIFKVELSETSTLGKIIDHGISIIERNNDYVVIFATDEDIVYADSKRGLSNFTKEELITYTILAFQQFYLRPSYIFSQIYRSITRNDYSLLIYGMRFLKAIKAMTGILWRMVR